MIAQYFAPDEFDGYTRAPYKPLFLWGQSVFIIAQLLTAGLLHINELDMIRRYLPSYNRPRKGGRYSAFQVSVAAALRSSECVGRVVEPKFRTPSICESHYSNAKFDRERQIA